MDSLLAAEQKRPIVALLTAHDAEQDSIGLDPIIVALLEAGSDDSVCFGRASESLHDRIDEIVVERGLTQSRQITTTWHEDETGAEVVEFLVKSSRRVAHGGYSRRNRQWPGSASYQASVWLKGDLLSPRSCDQICDRLRPIPDHSSELQRTTPSGTSRSTSNSYAHLHGLGDRTENPQAHSSAFLITPAHSSAHVFVED